MVRNRVISELSNRSPSELMALTVGEIVAQLISAHRAGKDVNLNRLKSQLSSKYALKNQPKLVDIIAAVPIDYRVCLHFSIVYYSFV